MGRIDIFGIMGEQSIKSNALDSPGQDLNRIYDF